MSAYRGDPEALASILLRCQTVLGNMAMENEGAIFNRWPINHEPLRSDARNLLPLIKEALAAHHTAAMEDIRRPAQCTLDRAAIIEECAKVVEPKGPRPCDCDRCYCHNMGDAEAVASWDADAYNAKAIRALAVPSTDGKCGASRCRDLGCFGMCEASTVAPHEHSATTDRGIK